MTAMLLAEFDDSDRLKEAVRRLPETDAFAHDAYTPFPVPGLPEMLPSHPPRVRGPMLVGFLFLAGGAFFMEWLSATYLYPINSGGRPLNSWQVFVLFPFEIGVLGAAAFGFVALLWRNGLPRLNHPLFDVNRFVGASQDRFFLAAAPAAPGYDARRVHAMLVECGATNVVEVGL